MTRYLVAATLATTVLTPGVVVADSQPIPSGKKIIMTGAGMPSVMGAADSVQWMEERVPFLDGVALYPAVRMINGEVSEAMGRMFRPTKHKLEDFQPGIDSLLRLKANARRYICNFLYTYLTSGDKSITIPDFFDAEFEAVVHNWRVTAEFCSQGGLRGIIFDDEPYYGRNPWDYAASQYKDTKTATQYADQAFKRGAEIMAAVKEVFPDIHIIFLHGPSQAGEKASDPATGSGLMAAFFDGMLSQCEGDARLIDGHELAYGFRYALSFERSRRIMKEVALQASRVPDQYRRFVQAGFPLIIGPFGTLGFRADNFAANYYTPEEFAYALHQALTYSDEYVWLYSNGPNWWSGWSSDMGSYPPIPMAYVNALSDARNPQPPMPLLRNLDASAYPYPGSGMPPRKLDPLRTPYSEQGVFGDLWENYEFICDIGAIWRFRIDPENVGVNEKWFSQQWSFDSEEVPDRPWNWITSDLCWDEQGYRLYDGYAWYRQDFKCPRIPPERKTYLAFGGVAHGAEVYLNGQLAGSHHMDGWAYTPGEPWKQPFLIDVTGSIRPEQANLLAVRVADYGPWGAGIYRPVKLIIQR